MTSFIRICDIPPDELHLLAIVGLRQQIREDRNRPSPRNNRTDPGEREDSSRGQTYYADRPPADLSAATREGFVTDWQMPDEPWTSAGLPFDREDSHNDQAGEGEAFGHKEFGDPEEEEVGEQESRSQAGGSHNTGDDFDALYMDIGGEG